ncbi:hypothetical protein [Streptomyces sp. NRRL S-350]|uniref:hypothetical protein n=1 Tax=Streptomyces sp. NRRL S-350 TaxID=1463902 RepID=UPI0004C10ADC|nr:hypothetical protein [Streptomyces sp. NRRL S-350]
MPTPAIPGSAPKSKPNRHSPAATAGVRLAGEALDVGGQEVEGVPSSPDRSGLPILSITEPDRPDGSSAFGGQSTWATL